MKPYTLSFIIMMTILYVSGSYLNIYEHELTHAQIDTYFGAQNISVHVGLFGGETDANYSQVVNMQLLYALHSVNEIMGYQYNMIFAIFMLAITAIGYFMIEILWKEESKKEGRIV